MSSNSSRPSPTQRLLSTSQLIYQGAEAKVYKAYLRDSELRQKAENVDNDDCSVIEDVTIVPVLLKYRFNKRYRHPSLDASLTRQRIAGEARALMRCLRSGVNVPGVRMVDVAEGVLGLEWIEGRPVRVLLPGGSEEVQHSDGTEGVGPNAYGDAALAEIGVERDNSIADDLLNMIGVEIAKMHLADIIHGDLTTSNMMLREGSKDLVLIDFGLAYHSTLVEDKAVDLYVLERAFASTHPDAEPLFSSVLASYEKHLGKHWSAIKKRLNDVRLRGRKRSMVG
ncbi:kinase-like domain-containing protein [Pisolithus croceorrhizus]|nr:kinase-like domain-containing protein [Pisolithus croceorrhizus]